MVRSSIAARVSGSSEYPDIAGTVTFRPMLSGTWVSANIVGLPTKNNFHGFHLHSGEVCKREDNFESALGHYNPSNQRHPNHEGDFPPLLSCDGMAQLEFYTCRFMPQDVVGKTVIIHAEPDDFRTDPAGRAGKRIACGVVEKI